MSGKRRDLFCNSESFMFRTPTEAVSDIRFTEEVVRNACMDPAFREKVSIAAPSLIEMMDLYLNYPEQLSEKKREGLFASVMKYYVRSRTRTTPFGLFAGVGIGSFGDTTHFGIRGARYEKRINIDAEWLYGYIRQLEKQYMTQLAFQVNHACTIRGNRAALIYTTEKDTEEISVRYTKVFEIIHKVCSTHKVRGDYRSFPEIFGAVKEVYKDTPDETIRAYIAELVERQILISGLRPPLGCRDQLLYLMKQCEAAGLTEESAKLSEVKEQFRMYEHTAIGEGTAKYQEISRRMKGFYDVPFCTQVDTVVSGAEVCLAKETAAQIRRLADFFVATSCSPRDARTHLDEYRDKFIEKYGMKREVLLLEMLDTSVGIGAPTGYMNPRNDFFEERTAQKPYNMKLKGYLIRKYERALADKSFIQLKQEEMEDLLTEEISPNEVPVSLELAFRLKNEDGRQRLYLGAGCGSNGAGKTFGRFSVLSEEMEEVLLTLNEEEKKRQGEDVELCEVSFLPPAVRNGNIVRALSGREKELTAYTGACKGRENCVLLKDIFIGVERGQFYARNKATGKRILFEANNMYNPLLMPNAMRFLLEIAEEGTRNWSELPWRYVYADYRHVPEIRFEDIVLESEKWKVSPQELGGKKKSYSEFKERFLAFAAAEHLPEKIYLTEADNRIWLDLSTDTSLRIVYDELKKSAGDLIFERTEAGEENVYDNGKAYATEIVVPLFRRLGKEKIVNFPCRDSAGREAHMVYPFDEWLYFKLYCKEDLEEELIAFSIPEFCEPLKARFGIDYFFMRYADPKPHIRLRFHGERDRLYEALPFIMDWCSELSRSHRIGDMNLSVYEREIERYGGARLIGRAEQLFCADSFAVENIVNWKRTGSLSFTQEEAAVVSVLLYVTHFYDSLEEQLRFMELYYHTSSYRNEFKEKKDRLLAVCDMENGWRNLCAGEDGARLYALLNGRNPLITAYKEAIEEERRQPEFKSDIVASVLHLHCNRLLGTDRELERKVMAFAESVLYAKKFVLGSREKRREHETDQSAVG